MFEKRYTIVLLTRKVCSKQTNRLRAFNNVEVCLSDDFVTKRRRGN